MERRELLKLGALAGAGSALGLRPGAELSGRMAEGDPPIRREVRNVIFLAYDGTGYEDLATADFFSREVVGRPLRFRKLLEEGRSGSMIPSSLTAWVTDSAAASTAWATGRKIVNGALSQLPDGRDLTTIMELAQGGGRATGLVTSARITHATPAAWIARVPDRNMEDRIAEQYLQFRPDLLLGGGLGPFDPAHRFDGRDLLSEFRSAGYDVALDGQELRAATGPLLLGVFTPDMDHLPYEVDRRFQEHPAPTLAELTRTALERLEAMDRGFLLQVEAGRIDHANHNNDPGGMIWDWIAADEALAVIMDFVDARDDTLLVFACDHDTGGGVAYGWGSGYGATDPALRTLAEARASHEWLLRDVLPPRPSPVEVEEAVAEYLGIRLDREQSHQISAVLAGVRPGGMRWGHRNAHGGGRRLQMAQILSHSPEDLPDRPPLSFSTGNHTAGFVPAALYGAGVEPGGLGLVDNTELFHVMTRALGTPFRNPGMSPEEARELAGGS